MSTLPDRAQPDSASNANEEMIRALAAAHLPEEVRDQLDGTGMEIELDEPYVPPLLQQGLAQAGVGVPELWARLVMVQYRVHQLERERDRHERERDRLERKVERLDGSRMTEGHVIRQILTIAALLLAIAGLILSLVD